MPDDDSLRQTVDAVLGRTVVIAVHSYRLCLAADDCPGLRPPDLVPQLTSSDSQEYPPPTQTSVDTTTMPGHVLLRFATSTANLGGLLDVVGLPTSAGSTKQLVQQRIYGDGVVLVRDAGEFVYHPEHHHFHIADFENYVLRSKVDNHIVARGTKLSFCLTDIEALAPPVRKSGDVFLDLPPLDCGVHEQGINTGYSDYYGSKLDGQWIDVTSLPSGHYWLEFTANPDGHLLESNTANNTARFDVDYRRPALG